MRALVCSSRKPEDARAVCSSRNLSGSPLKKGGLGGIDFDPPQTLTKQFPSHPQNHQLDRPKPPSPMKYCYRIDAVTKINV